MITLDKLNALSNEEAYIQLESCCVSSHWINKMIENRPFASEKKLIDKMTTYEGSLTFEAARTTKLETAMKTVKTRNYQVDKDLLLAQNDIKKADIRITAMETQLKTHMEEMKASLSTASRASFTATTSSGSCRSLRQHDFAVRLSALSGLRRVRVSA